MQEEQRGIFLDWQVLAGEFGIGYPAVGATVEEKITRGLIMALVQNPVNICRMKIIHQIGKDKSEKDSSDEFLVGGGKS
jgi:hypothetical protein